MTTVVIDAEGVHSVEVTRFGSICTVRLEDSRGGRVEIDMSVRDLRHLYEEMAEIVNESAASGATETANSTNTKVTSIVP